MYLSFLAEVTSAPVDRAHILRGLLAFAKQSEQDRAIITQCKEKCEEFDQQGDTEVGCALQCAKEVMLRAGTSLQTPGHVWC